MTSPIKVELQLDTGKFQTDLKNAINALSGIESKADGVAGSIKNIESGSEKAAAGLRRVTAAGNNFVSVFRDISIITNAFSQAMFAVTSISSGWLGDIVRVNSEMERLNYQMRAMSTASDPIKDAAENVAWLRKEAAQAPFSLKAITDSFTKMKATSLEPKNGMLKSFMDGLATFGGGDEQLNRVSIAIQQMAGKSVIQMEELRQQLGEHMPTAMQLLARSMGMTVAQLSKTVATGTLDARSSLQKLSDEMERAYGGASLRMMQSFSGQVSKLKTNLQLLVTDTGGEAFFSVIKKELMDINEFLVSNEAKVYAQQIGNALAEITLSIKNSLNFVWEYRDALLSLGKAVTTIYAIKKLSQMFSTFGSVLDNSLAGLKGAFSTVRWGLGALADGVIGLKTGQSVFTSLQLGALGFGTALKGVAASVPLIGIAFVAIQGVVELFSNWESEATKAKRATQEAYEAAKNGTTKNYEETKKSIDNQIAQLKKEEEIAKSKANQTYYPKWVYALNNLRDVSGQGQEDYNKALADYIKANKERTAIEAVRESLEANKKREDENAGARSVENIIYSRGDKAQREYNDRQRELDRLRKLEISNAAKTGADLHAITTKLNEEKIASNKKYYNANLTIIDDELRKQENLLKRYLQYPTEDNEGHGEFFVRGAIKKLKELKDGLTKQINDSNPASMTAETLSSPVNNEETRIKNANKTALKLKETIFDLKGEVSGATNAFTQMFAQLAAGKYGELDSTIDGVQRLHRELLEMAGEKTVFDKMREGFSGLQNDLDRIKKKNLEQRIQNAIRKEEADNGGIKLSETEKLRIAIREGKYFGVGSGSIIENQFNDLAKEVTSQTKLAAALGNVFRKDTFGNETVKQINDVKASLDGVSNSLSGISGIATGIDIGSSLKNSSSLNNSENAKAVSSDIGLAGYRPNFEPLSKLGLSLTTGIAEFNNTIKGSANLMSKNMMRWGNPYSDNWRENNITKITTNSGKSVMVHKDAASSFLGFINELEDEGYKINSLGGYNLRSKRGSRSLSEHAFGNAIDINPATNPMGKAFVTDMPNNISELAAKWGLSWGGDWKSVKDAMHFEWTGRRAFAAPTDLKVPQLNLDDVKKSVVEALSNTNAITDKNLDDSEEAERRTRRETFEADIASLKETTKRELSDIYKRPIDAGSKYDAAIQSMRDNGENPEADSNKRILDEMARIDAEYAAATKDQKLRNDMKQDELKLTTQIAEYNKKAANPNYQGQSQEIKNILATYDELLKKAEQFDGGKNSAVYKSIEANKSEALKRQASLELAQHRATTAQETQDIHDNLMTQSQLRQTQLQRDLAVVDEWLEHMRANGADEVAITEEAEKKKANIREKYAQQVSPVQKQMREWSDINDQIDKSTTGWMDSIAGGIAGLATNTNNLRSVVTGIVNDLAKIAVKGMLSGMFGGRSGKGGKGGAGAAKSLLTKGGAVHHTGGIAGNRGAFRAISALAWMGAPKFHSGGLIKNGSSRSGLLPSEVPIIAREGEGVFTPDQMAAMGGFQQNQSIQINSPITVNGSAGTPEQNEDLAKKMARQMEGTMRGLIADEMRKQSRPGSLMNNRTR